MAVFCSLEPQLQKMRGQHRLQRKRRPADAALGGNTVPLKCAQRSPANNTLHLLHELTLARLPGTQIQLKTCLFYGGQDAMTCAQLPDNG